MEITFNHAKKKKSIFRSPEINFQTHKAHQEKPHKVKQKSNFAENNSEEHEVKTEKDQLIDGHHHHNNGQRKSIFNLDAIPKSPKLTYKRLFETIKFSIKIIFLCY